MRGVVAAVASALVFLSLDAVWLRLAGPRLYVPAIGPLLADSPNLAAAAAFYLIYLAGLFALATAPGLAAGRWRVAALRGLMFGVAAYATYDLTNQATLRLWSTRLTLIDMAWGGALSALAAAAGYGAARLARKSA